MDGMTGVSKANSFFLTFTQVLSYPFLAYPSSSCLFDHSVLYLVWPFLDWDTPN